MKLKGKIMRSRTREEEYDLKFSRRLYVIKSFRATSCVNSEQESNVSETLSVSIMREWWEDFVKREAVVCNKDSDVC
jgi:hypothetical protein